MMSAEYVSENDFKFEVKNMYENEYKRIIEASKNNALTLFVGAGVSVLSNAPKWSEMIDRICEELGLDKKGKYSADECLQIPQIYYNEIGKNDNKYYSIINECLNAGSLIPNEIHKMLFKLAPASILTTNFDELLETAAAQECYSMKVIAAEDEIASINGGRFILKVHGDLKHRNIVFKEEDYLSYSENFKLTETLLKSIFSTNTVLFIGYGLNDYNIKLILNWSKSLLKEKFNKPIFIYTDNEKLSSSQLKYHESRGLRVIDFHNLIDGTSEFIDRYKTILESILHYSDTVIENKNKYELFDVLYRLLLPLDSMFALRPKDIEKRLSPYIILNNNTITVGYNQPNLLEYFLEILQIAEDEREKLPTDVFDKFNHILSVFRKGLIQKFDADNCYEVIDDKDIDFADEQCITFLFMKMNKFVNKKSKNLHYNYQKAFYLAKLNRFEESYNLFSKVAVQALINKNYLLFYLSQINRNSVLQTIKCINNAISYYNMYSVDNKESYNINFNQFPVEFQNDYDTISDLSSISSLLFKNFYDSFIESEKIEKEIDNTTYHIGGSAIVNNAFIIRNNIHFILGNYLLIDDFLEFKNSVKHTLNYLLQYYSIQNNSTRKGSIAEFFGSSSPQIIFDEIDFYCFVEYYKSDEIRELIQKYKITSIKFNKIEIIEEAIENIINYYDKILLKQTTKIELDACELKIKNCLILLKYINISQKLVDKICTFIFKYEFKNILIGEKILFLDAQLSERKMYSNHTRKIIAKTFCIYFTLHINSIKEKSNFNLYSNSKLNYYHLINYISNDIHNFSCPKLSKLISEIIANNYKFFCPIILEHYYHYLSKSQQNKVYLWAKKILFKSFDFKIFTMLLDKNKTIDKKIITALKNYLKEQINKTKYNKFDEKNKVFPLKNNFEELIYVGYWCFTGMLKHEDFKEFIGINNNFDFYFLYEKFDFSKFDVCFLLHNRNYVYEKLAENEIVKSNIRVAVSEAIKSKKLHYKDEEELNNILIRYFC